MTGQTLMQQMEAFQVSKMQQMEAFQVSKMQQRLAFQVSKLQQRLACWGCYMHQMGACQASHWCQVKSALPEVISLAVLQQSSGLPSVCMWCLFEMLLLSMAAALFCREPIHVYLGTPPSRGRRLSAGGHSAATADRPSGPQAACTLVSACQSRCPSCQKAAACWSCSAAGWCCQWCSSWLGRAACCCRLHPSLGQQRPCRPGGGRAAGRTTAAR